MAASPTGLTTRLTAWLLQRPPVALTQGPFVREGHHEEQPWWRVMCLTGVDYFSTLGYQPGIAALAAGALSPLATLILVLLTLFGALPMYRRVAEESPHGEGSITMLERLLSWWQGKVFVLCLLGFVATDFVITITLSAADAATHAVENPFVPQALADQQMGVTLSLIALLGLIFLKGFREAIGIAVVLVVAYLALNAVVVVVSLGQVLQHPAVVADWQRVLLAEQGSPLRMLAVALLVFPKLALGMSGFETGVVVMPLVRGAPDDDPARPAGRIRNTRRLLLTAALIMSIFLVASSFVTITLIPAEEFLEGGKANGRALAYLAHQYLGAGFGTAYDVSTILILWFAGASAMAGLLNIVPRYLPRYGMAPEWAGAARPLVLVFTAVAFAVTVIFRANVDEQSGAYATGVLVLMTSAAFAVTLAVHRQGRGRATVAFALIALVFAYTTVANVFERPEGVRIASVFIAAILVTSLISRVARATELRVATIALDSAARRFVEEASRGEIRIIAHDTDTRSRRSYAEKEREQRACHNLPPDDPILFLEIHVRDSSEFTTELDVRGAEVAGYRVLRAESSTVPNAIAALLLYIRDQTDKIPHVYFAWPEANPWAQVARFLLFGEGDIPLITHEVLREQEPIPDRRPVCHVA